MVGLKHLLVSVVVGSATLLLGPTPSASAADEKHCTAISLYTTCPKDTAQARTNNSEVLVTGERSLATRAGSGVPGGVAPGKRATVPKRVLTPNEIQALWDEQCYGLGSCTVGSSNGLNNLLLPRAPAPAAPAVPGAPAQVVTITDVERFVPAVGALHMEPDGWAVVGVPANFWATVEPAVVQGELLGAPAEVRFTPRLYRWQYGDGTTRTTEAAGTSWAASGQDELTATPTGHIYEQKADLGASVTVVWSAEYRVAGGDWIAVAGAVTSTSPDSRVLVVRERTVLTAR